MSLLFNTLPRIVIAFLPRSKCLLISWLQLPSAVLLEPKKLNLSLFPLFPLLFTMKWWDWMPWSSFFWYWVSSQPFHSSLAPSSRGSLDLHFMPLKWYLLHIWGVDISPGNLDSSLWVIQPLRFAWCILHISWISRVTTYNLDILLSQFWTSLLFYVQF